MRKIVLETDNFRLTQDDDTSLLPSWRIEEKGHDSLGTVKWDHYVSEVLSPSGREEYGKLHWFMQELIRTLLLQEKKEK